MKQCKKCGGTYHDTFFRLNQRKSATLNMLSVIGRSAICRGCEQTAKDEYKRENRFRQKVHDTRRRHANKFHMTVKELEILGWTSSRMEHEAAHSYSNGCPVCGRPYSTMGHGLRDLTLDIIIPDAPKIYGTNTRWICSTCNSKKSRTSIEVQATDRLDWMEWEKNRKEKERNPMYGLPLFSGFESQSKLDWNGKHALSI